MTTPYERIADSYIAADKELFPRPRPVARPKSAFKVETPPRPRMPTTPAPMAAPRDMSAAMGKLDPEKSSVGQRLKDMFGLESPQYRNFALSFWQEAGRKILRLPQNLVNMPGEIAQRVTSQPGGWRLLASAQRGELTWEEARETLKEGSVLMAEQLVPGVDLARNWGGKANWERVLGVALDAAFVGWLAKAPATAAVRGVARGIPKVAQRAAPVARELALGEAGMVGKVPKKPPTTAVAKEPWQMTRAEYVESGIDQIKSFSTELAAAPEARRGFESLHGKATARALSEGKPVPAEVLKDYPDLAARASQVPAEGRRAFLTRLAREESEYSRELTDLRRRFLERPEPIPEMDDALLQEVSEAIGEQFLERQTKAQIGLRLTRAADASRRQAAGYLTQRPPRAPVAPAEPPVRAGVVPEVTRGVEAPAREAIPEVSRARRLEAMGPREDWRAFAQKADPSGGALPPRGGVPTETGARMPPPDRIDDVFERIRRQAAPGETPPQTLLRRHEAAITSAENEARVLVEEGKDRLRAMNIGLVRQGRLVPRQKDVAVLDELFEALHNPSKVADGTMRVPKGLEREYTQLRGLTDWEEAMRIDFDPAMATVDDYFYRGWVVPKEGAAKPTVGPPRGRLGTTPAFKKPRVDATYREMRDAGFEPLSWNPYEQWRISRLQGVRYRQQMQLIDDLKKLELAVTDASGVGIEGWRTPRVGPAFEGKIFATTDAAGEPVAMYSRRWVVSSDLANRLENIYGVRPDLGTVHVGNRSINLMKAIDLVTFVPKRAKLFGSLFQQMDFLTRSGVGAWTGMVDALIAGQPVTAVKRLAVWPKSAIQIVEANIRPGARAAIRKQLRSTDPLVPGRPGIHLRGISEAGLSTIDTTLLPANIDTLAKTVAEEVGLLGNKAVRRVIGSLESTMRRGLFEGTYPAAQITDIKNNIAPMIVRRYGKGLSDEAINGMIARIVNKKYSTIPASQSVVQNRALRETFRRIFFSMGESEGLLRQAAGAIRGPEAGYWRTHWIGAYLGLMSVASAIHFASTGEPLPWSRWLPVNRNKWGPLPLGYNQEFAAPNIPIMDKTSRQLTLDLVGQLDTAFRILDPPGFLSSRESVPIRTLTTQITERDYFGRPITGVGPGGIYSRTANLISDMFAPIGVGQSAIQIGLQQGRVPSGLIPAVEKKMGVAGQVVQATGLNLRAQIGTRWDAELEAYYEIETTVLKRAKKKQPLSRPEYRARHPEVDAKLFITGQVTSLKNLVAAAHVRRLVAENNLDPTQIKAVQKYQEDQEEWQRLGLSPGRRDFVDNLIRDLLRSARAPAVSSATQQWRSVQPHLNSTTLWALYKLWYQGGKLAEQEEMLLRRVFRKVPLGQTNFNQWAKSTLRQVYENSVITEKRQMEQTPRQESIPSAPAPTPGPALFDARGLEKVPVGVGR